jgi:hypothetical protein
MPLRLACDLDGTLADMNAALQREAERIFGEPVDLGTGLRGVAATKSPSVVKKKSSADVRSRKRLNERERSRLWKHVRGIDNFWETLTEVESGAVARLAATVAVQGWEVVFLTTRPDTAGDPVQVQSQRWLRAHGFDCPSVCVVSESRGRIAASLSLDVVIDDRPDNCADVTADSRARSVLVWRDSAERLPPGLKRLPIQVVSSIAEALDHITSLPSRPVPPAGLLGRLRQAFQHL